MDCRGAGWQSREAGVYSRASPSLMKTCLVRLFLSLLGAAPLAAAFVPATFEVTVEPVVPASLSMTSLRECRVTLALDLGSDGRLTDSLVTTATHAALARPCLEAVQQWRFQPARFDGEPVPSRVEVVINFVQNGAVVSLTAIETVAARVELLAGRPPDFRVCRADEIDRPLTVVTRVNPEYARDAEQRGVGGRVEVHFFVDEQGNVRLPAVPAETHPYLSAVAVEAMRGWKFEPPTRHGRPVLVAAVQAFDFGGPAR